MVCAREEREKEGKGSGEEERRKRGREGEWGRRERGDSRLLTHQIILSAQNVSIFVSIK